MEAQCAYRKLKACYCANQAFNFLLFCICGLPNIKLMGKKPAKNWMWTTLQVWVGVDGDGGARGVGSGVREEARRGEFAYIVGFSFIYYLYN